MWSAPFTDNKRLFDMKLVHERQIFSENRVPGPAKLRSAIDVDCPCIEIFELAGLFAQLDRRPTVCSRVIILDRRHNEWPLALANARGLRCIDQLPKVRPELGVSGYAVEDFVADYISEDRRMLDRAFHQFAILPDVIVQPGAPLRNHSAISVGKHNHINWLGSAIPTVIEKIFP